MASGDTLAIFTPLHNEPPATSYATIDTVNAVSPRPVLDFDASSVEIAIFSHFMPRNYAGGGITSYITGSWSSDVTSTNNTVLWFAFERTGDGQQAITTDSFAANGTVTMSVAATALTDIANAAFSNGAEIDNIAVGELYRIKVTCDTTGSSHSGDFELHGIELKET